MVPFLVLLILALVALRYVDETPLRGPWLWLARHGIPSAAILMPAGSSCRSSIRQPRLRMSSSDSSTSAASSSSGALSRSASGYCAARRMPANGPTCDHELAATEARRPERASRSGIRSEPLTHVAVVSRG